MSSKPPAQMSLFGPAGSPPAGGPITGKDVPRLRTQLLKWIGNKQRFAHEIVALFPEDIATYREPFVGSAAVLATLAPERAVASDALGPLVDLYRLLRDDPEALIAGYERRWGRVMGGDKVEEYKHIRRAYNEAPNPLDLLFLSRSCYGGVIRFSKKGEMNTPCGAHRPVSPEAFRARVAVWRPRLMGTRFAHMDFEEAMEAAEPGDLVYCDPPYKDSEATLYGAQAFSLARLMAAIGRCKGRGVRVALSIDGSKRSGTKLVDIEAPEGLFETEVMVNCGRSMLRRFQMEGQTLEGEVVADRLLLTWG